MGPPTSLPEVARLLGQQVVDEGDLWDLPAACSWDLQGDMPLVTPAACQNEFRPKAELLRDQVS
jgi:hypothetical protein